MINREEDYHQSKSIACTINYQDVRLFITPEFLYYKKIINDPSVKNISFLRHGNTDWSMKMLINGPQDLPLNQRGRICVEELVSKKLNCVDVDLIISSNLKRCTETLAIVLKVNDIFFNKVQIDHGLQERNFGDWSTYKDLIAAVLERGDKTAYKEIQDIIEQNLPAGAETLEEFEIRVAKSFIKYLHPNSVKLETEAPLIISHGCVKSIIMQLMDLSDIDLSYGALMSFCFQDQEWRITEDAQQELLGCPSHELE